MKGIVNNEPLLDPMCLFFGTLFSGGSLKLLEVQEMWLVIHACQTFHAVSLGGWVPIQ